MFKRSITAVLFALFLLSMILVAPAATVQAARTQAISITDTTINNSKYIAGKTYGAASSIRISFIANSANVSFNYKIGAQNLAVVSAWTPAVTANKKSITWTLTSATVAGRPVNAAVLAQINATNASTVNTAIQTVITQELAKYNIKVNYQISQIAVVPGKLTLIATF